MKKVEKMAPPYFSSQKNKDHKTPRMIFTEEHMELKKEGEKWMRDTSTACSVVAVLIATIMFTASITVPGGSYGEISGFDGFNATITFPLNTNNAPSTGTITAPPGNDTNTDNKLEGSPIFFKHKTKRLAFKVFYNFNGASLVSSVTAVLMFLSILTSGFAEDSFRVNLPTRLIIGLFALISSICCMMAAFYTIIFLVFGFGVEGRQINGAILIVATGVPILIFLFLKLPLLLALMVSTWGRGLHGIIKKLSNPGIPQLPFSPAATIINQKLSNLNFEKLIPVTRVKFGKSDLGLSPTRRSGGATS